MPRPFFDLARLRVYPLAERKSLTQIEDVIIDPDSKPPAADEQMELIQKTAAKIRTAREKGASVILMYGAHLVRNGMGPTLIRMMEEGWITHLATNGAGTIHDWEYSFLGKSTESVRDNVETGTFGTWDETGESINLAVCSGAANSLGYGESLGKLIQEEELNLPDPNQLEAKIKTNPFDKNTAAKVDLLQLMKRLDLESGTYELKHPYKQYSVIGNAYRLNVPLTVHPGIGYDIISNHPGFFPAAIGRGAGYDYQSFVDSVTKLSDGLVLSVGSAIMAPQVFEKAMSCANNVWLQEGKRVTGHHISIVDMQDGGGWDWSQGEPPKDNPAYYLRFCKSFYRMGGTLDYICADNRVVVQNLYHLLNS